MKRIFLLLAITLLPVLITHQTLANDERQVTEHTITSNVLNEEVTLYVQLPLYYNENAHFSYPVLYLLDAPQGITLNSGILDELVGYNTGPQMIIVGLSSNNRDRDYTPTLDTHYGTETGGANEYLAFVEKEAIPFIDASYRTEPYRVLSGHSYGGLLVSHAFYTIPNVFNAYFTFSPSLFWGEQAVAKSMVSFIHKQQRHNRMLYLNMGNEGNPETDSPEGKQMLAGVKMIERALKRHTPDKFLAIVTRNCKEATAIKIHNNDIPITTVLTRECAPAKPDPTALLMIAEQWQLPPAELLYVGDYIYDQQAAENAGMQWLLV